MKMKPRRIMVLLAFLSLVLSLANVTSTRASSGDDSLAKNLAKIKKQVAAQQHDFDWTRQAWTAEDRPYMLVQAHVDQAIAQGQKPDSLLVQCRAEALAHPDDTKLLFRWAYAAYLAASQVELTPSQADLRLETPGSIDSVQGFMIKKYVPSYQYARLLFLLLNFNSIDSRTEYLGDRLLQRNPNDKEVKYDMILFRSWDSRPSVRQQAQQEAEQLAQQGSPEGYWILANIYYRMWNVSKMPPTDTARTQPIAEKAVAALRRYVQLAPLQSGKRKLAQRQITNIEQDQSQIAAGTYR